MLRLRVVLAAVLTASALVVLAGPAHAGVAAASNPKFCTAFGSVDQSSLDKPTAAKAKAAAQEFERAEKVAPANIKSALSTMSSFLQKVAKTPKGLPALAQSPEFASYLTAISKVLKYTESACT